MPCCIQGVIHLSGAVCRPDAITAPDLDQLFGGHLNLALMHPFAMSIQLDQAPVSTCAYCHIMLQPTAPLTAGIHVAETCQSFELLVPQNATSCRRWLHHLYRATPTRTTEEDKLVCSNSIV